MRAAGRGLSGGTAPLLAVLALLLLQLVPLRFRDETPFWNELINAGHLPLFGLATLLLFAAFERVRGARRYALTGGVAVAVAALVERIQPYFARTRSLDDLLTGALGVVLALAGLVVVRSAGGKASRAAFAAVGLAACGIVLAPALLELRALRWRSENFPLLGDFERDVELRLWRPQGGRPGDPTTVRLSAERSRAGTRSLEVRAGDRNGGAAPGVHYLAGDENWEPFAELRAEVYNPGDPLALSLRIDDDGDTSEANSRFQVGLVLAPGWNEIRVPTAEIRDGPVRRRLNLRAIRRVILFTAPGMGPRMFFLDDVRLRPGHPDRTGDNLSRPGQSLRAVRRSGRGDPRWRPRRNAG